MKIAVAYPPIPTWKGTPLLSQNRQFQYFNDATFVYPMVPAYAATNLAAHDYDVVWLDGIAEGWTYEEFCQRVDLEGPDLLMLETKTPVVKKHWELISDLKKRFDGLRVVIVGDHVTALPEETLRMSPVDFVLTGGDYDFLIVNLANHLTRGEEMEGGIWWRDGDQVRNSGPMALKPHKLDDLPMVDRELTRWPLYAYDNGNFKYKPGTYTYAGRDCWWGKCTFCVWDHTLYPPGNFRMHSPERLLDEVGHLIENYGIKEIFDDCGTLPIGAWLKKFCRGMIERGYNKKIKFGCNMKPGHLNQEEYDLMAEAGFRFILYGIESANENTLQKLDKGNSVQDIEDSLRMASQAGLHPHITVMIGYPWESHEDSKNTVDFAKRMFKKGYVETLQGTIVVPYPGTPLFKECQEKSWLLTEDWDRYDMRESVMKNPITSQEARTYTQDLYKAFLSPQYITRKLLSIRSLDDIKFFTEAGKKLVGHLLDFKKDQPVSAEAAD